MNDTQWSNWAAAGGNPDLYAGSSFFEENEEFANWGARALSDLLGRDLPTGFVPTFGYEYGDLTR